MGAPPVSPDAQMGEATRDDPAAGEGSRDVAAGGAVLLGAPQPGQECWHPPTGQTLAESVWTSSTGDDMLGMNEKPGGAWGGEMPGLDPLHHPHMLLVRQEFRAQREESSGAFPCLASHPAHPSTSYLLQIVQAGP